MSTLILSTELFRLFQTFRSVERLPSEHADNESLPDDVQLADTSTGSLSKDILRASNPQNVSVTISNEPAITDQRRTEEFAGDEAACSGQTEETVCTGEVRESFSCEWIHFHIFCHFVKERRK